MIFSLINPECQYPISLTIKTEWMAEEKHILSPGLLEMGGVILKYLQKDISPEQEALLKDWLLKSEHNKKLFEELQDNDSLIAEMKRYNESIARTESAKLRAVEEAFPKSSKVKRMSWFRYAVAAVLLIMLGGGYYLFFKSKPDKVKQEEVVAKAQHDVEPGQFKAKLTLADGSVLVLDSFSNNRLVQQGGTNVYTRDGELIYNPAKSKEDKEIFHNTLTTARGESYKLILPDGSKAWLNAASSVRFPVSFTGNERRIEITGEVLMEVVSNKTKPFIVSVNNTEVKVLGTVFNVNSYEEENGIITTLVEGKVLLTKGSKSLVLTPGQQAQVTEEGNMELDKEADIDKATGWQRGLFVFKGDDVKTVMNQLARWYDVKVIYKGEIKDKFYAVIKRNQSASNVLYALEQSSGHYKIDGNTIIVSP